eukprot:TRINITY_DN31524_c0_g1_i1.p1 TRINITY_DN31524_c0_g1~~TRINITY_DN31524_c0_g1_i1.p1  ORF type:complete len:330 (-),score=50.75 TRINITY_DN31524_c0_g1_i1:317-1225(-)
MVQRTSLLAVPCTVPAATSSRGEAGVERTRAVARRKFANLQVELDIAKAVEEVRGANHSSVQVFSMGTPQDSGSFPSNEHFIGTPTGSDSGKCMGDTRIENQIAFGDLLFSFIDSSDLASNGRRAHGDCCRVADETSNSEADKDVSPQTSCVSSSPRRRHARGRSGCRGSRSRGRSSSSRCSSSGCATSSNRSNRSIGVSSSCVPAVCVEESVLKPGKSINGSTHSSSTRSRSSSACTSSGSRMLSSELPCLRAAALQNIAAANEALLQDVLKGPPLAFDGYDDMDSDCEADLSCFDLELSY